MIELGAGSRVSGVRLRGPSTDPTTPAKTIGLQVRPGGTAAVVDNSDLYAWPWAAVSVKQASNVQVRYNYIHDNHRSERGYGVVVQNGQATAEIQCNVFDANRHSIAGSGLDGEGYWAHDNLLLNGGGRSAYHQFDMHLGATGHGGRYVRITDNLFDYGRYGTSNRSSVRLRGIPTDGPAIASNNLFSQGWTVGSQVAISGVDGSLPSAAQLQASNRFAVPFTYRRLAANDCRVGYAGRETPVVCAAVSSLLPAD